VSKETCETRNMLAENSGYIKQHLNIHESYEFDKTNIRKKKSQITFLKFWFVALEIPLESTQNQAEPQDARTTRTIINSTKTRTSDTFEATKLQMHI
jgi:hypothetical protein